MSVVDVEQQTVSVKFEIYENQPGMHMHVIYYFSCAFFILGFEAYVYEVVHLTSPRMHLLVFFFIYDLFSSAEATEGTSQIGISDHISLFISFSCYHRLGWWNQKS